MIPGIVAGGPSNAAPPAPGVAWNPSDKDGSITLSSEDRIATKGGGNSYGCVRAAASLTVGGFSGLAVVEYRVIQGATSPFIALGLGKSTATLTSYVGADANGFAYYQETGTKLNNGGGTAYGSDYQANGSIITLAFSDDGNLEFWKNGVSQGLAFSGLSGAFFPMAALYRGTDTNHSVEIRSRSSDIEHMPVGGTAWSDLV